VRSARNGRGELRNRRSEDDGESAEEPLYTHENRRKNEANLHQCDEEAYYHGITIVLTSAPEAHNEHLDERHIYTARLTLKMFTIDHFLRANNLRRAERWA